MLNKTKRTDRRKRGRWGEFLARMFMRLHGYSILRQNYVTGRGTTAGEIDFIARRNQEIVFVEVKERQSLENAAYALKGWQRQRILNAARFFLQSNPQYSGYNIRFDAVLVKLPFSLRHVPNAWGE